MDLDSQAFTTGICKVSSIDAVKDFAEDEDDKKQVRLNKTNVTWQSVSSSSLKQVNQASNQLSSSNVTGANRSYKVSPYLGGFVNPLDGATTPLKKNLTPVNYYGLRIHFS